MAPSWRSLDARGKVIDQFYFGNHDDGGRVYCIVRQTLYQAVYNAAARSGVEIVTDSNAEGATPEGELLIEGGKTLQGGSRHRCRRHLFERARFAEPAEAAAGSWRRRNPARGSLRRRGSGRSGLDADRGTLVDRPRRVLYTPCSRDTLYLCLTSVASDREALSIPVPKEVWARSVSGLCQIHRADSRGGPLGPLRKRLSPSLVEGPGRPSSAMPPTAWFRGWAKVAARRCAMRWAWRSPSTRSPTSPRALAIWEARERPLTEHTQFWSWTTWPLTRVPPMVARAVFQRPANSALGG